MEELDLALEEKSVLKEQMKPGQLEEVKENTEMGEQRLWELDKILEDLSRHKDNPDD